MAGDLWTVFDFDISSGLTRIRTVGSEEEEDDVDDHWKIFSLPWHQNFLETSLNIQFRPKLHIYGKEFLSQKQREGNNIYVTREAQVEDLTGKPTWGAMVMTSSSCSTIQVEFYNNFIKHWSSSQGQSHHLLWVTPTNSSQSDNLQVKSPILVKQTDWGYEA